MSKETQPSYILPDGSVKQGEMPAGAYLRMRTEDDIVYVTEHRPDPDGDGFGQSHYMYGPFKTGDEEREFMKNIARSIATGAQYDAICATIDAWRRHDED